MQQVGFLREFADAEAAVGNSTGATLLRSRADAMAAAMNTYLWDGSDHFVTQVDHQCDGNPSSLPRPSCGDWVDYDSKDYRC